MAISLKQQVKQSQGLSMTPQLAQSIKLLQMNSLELIEHIEKELESNPLLELRDPNAERQRGDGQEKVTDTKGDNTNPINSELETSRHGLEENLGTSLENEFDTDRSGGGDVSYTGTGSNIRYNTDSDYDIESFISGTKTLREHLIEQISLMRLDNCQRILISEIIDSLDTDGYFRRELADVAKQFSVSLEETEEALSIVQSLEPTGVGARHLGENIKLQLIEKNRFDPAIGIFVDNLDLLAKRDFQKLEKLSGLDHADMQDVVHEIRSLDPRPARRFENAPVQQIIPDVFVSEQINGSFGVELNTNALPKVLVNQTYKSIVEHNKSVPKKDIEYISECLQNAHWLTRSLEQRAETILKVTSEIVRLQDEFFAYGVDHLKPLTLRQVAEAIDMHESTVSRVTSNKFMQCARGVFELKFFFTSAIQSTTGEASHSAEAVRIQIKKLIEKETAEEVFSDDAIVEILRFEGIDVARRTVAKYRESMNIPSSVQRRREMKAMQK